MDVRGILCTYQVACRVEHLLDVSHGRTLASYRDSTLSYSTLESKKATSPYHRRGIARRWQNPSVEQ
jgi:hypothetical protein